MIRSVICITCKTDIGLCRKVNSLQWNSTAFSLSEYTSAVFDELFKLYQVVNPSETNVFQNKSVCVAYSHCCSTWLYINYVQYNVIFCKVYVYPLSWYNAITIGYGPILKSNRIYVLKSLFATFRVITKTLVTEISGNVFGGSTNLSDL